jgi:hypothetical protein
MLKPNPGGQLAPEEILGRDALIAKIWSILEGRSIYMNDLRRVGKSQIMVKMHALPLPNWLTVKRDLGGTHTAAEFATLAYKDSVGVLDTKKKALRTMQDLIGQARGSKIAGVIELPNGTQAPWKEVLRRTFADIEEAMVALGSNQRMLFFWDEVPYLLDNIARREGANVAMEVLDALRALGQDHDRIRLVLTGSIGLHHVLNGLKQAGYNGSPLNRMEHIQPGPLAPDSSVELTVELLQGGGISCEDRAACAVAIAESVGHVPFYIHKLISRLPGALPATPDSIAIVLDREITSDNNDWDFQHYRERLKPYYGEQERLALHVLDAVAAAEAPLTFQGLRQQANAQIPTDDEALRDLLRLLCMDYYLTRTPENAYRFYLDIIRRWWRLSRSLA